ncbi:hypothetical protein ACP8Y2_02900 [Herpetosiphon llansteffanensis]
MACGSGSSSTKPVQIRVHNATDRGIREVWLGSSGYTDSAPARNLAAGATSEYIGFETSLPNYRQLQIVMNDGARYLGVADPNPIFGQDDLPPGNYQFEISLVNDEPVVTIIQQ